MSWDEYNDEYLIEFTESQLAEHDAEVRAEAIENIWDILAELERCCIDHEENEIGEWLTFTFDYSVWADVLSRLKQLKSQTDSDGREMKSMLMYREMIKEIEKENEYKEEV